MRRLYLLRHAKSSWADSDVADHDRGLSTRGSEAVRRLARHLPRARVNPALVLCSSARRAVMTLEGIAAALPETTATLIEPELYGASSDGLLDRLRRLPEHVTPVMVIGHNPGLHDLAAMLVGAGDEVLLDELATKFPTGALATLRIPGRWADLGSDAATIEGFVAPRALS